MITAEDVKVKLAKYIISRDKYPYIPPSLDGGILAEEVRDKTRKFKLVLCISVEDMVNILNMRDKPTLRPDEEVEFKGKKRKLRGLTAGQRA